MNYFQLYEIPVSFLVEEKSLKQKYLSLSRKFHPDFYTGSDETKQAEMLALSTQNNKAFQTLSDFDKRIKYILMEKGYLEEEEKFALPQMFLMEMMDLNELAMEVEFDPAPEKKQEVLNHIQAAETALLEAITPILSSYSEATATESDYKAIKEFYYKRKYLLRIRAQLDKFAAD